MLTNLETLFQKQDSQNSGNCRYLGEHHVH
jgi:hypothetical protein